VSLLDTPIVEVGLSGPNTDVPAAEDGKERPVLPEDPMVVDDDVPMDFEGNASCVVEFRPRSPRVAKY
jgi:hypothetical protein